MYIIPIILGHAKFYPYNAPLSAERNTMPDDIVWFDVGRGNASPSNFKSSDVAWSSCAGSHTGKHRSVGVLIGLKVAKELNWQDSDKMIPGVKNNGWLLVRRAKENEPGLLLRERNNTSQSQGNAQALRFQMSGKSSELFPNSVCMHIVEHRIIDGMLEFKISCPEPR
jgi:hypothetical protein